MSVPILDTTTSVLGYPQGELWSYQPNVTNDATVTTWTWSGLPEGIEEDPGGTGAIFGAALRRGVYLLRLIASNGDGNSAPLLITVGIYSRTWMTDGAVPINIDLRSGLVYPPKLDGWKTDDPLAFGKDGDTLVFDIGFSADGGETLTPMDLEQLRCGIKEDDLGPVLVESDGEFSTIGDGTDVRYRILVPIETNSVLATLSDNEDESGTFFDAMAEIEWKQLVDYVGDRVSVLRSTQNFKLRIGKQLLT